MESLTTETKGYYLTREGDIVRVYKFDTTRDFPVYGMTDGGLIETYTQEGRSSEEQESEGDLVKFLGKKLTDF